MNLTLFQSAPEVALSKLGFLLQRTLQPIFPVSKKKIVGIIGNPLSHTLSPLMHNTAFELLGLDFTYLVFEVKSSADLRPALEGVRALGISGLNVTLPYKEQVVKHLDTLLTDANEVQAVNTVVNQGGLLMGYNTDIAAFAEPLLPYRDKLKGRMVSIFGNGGSARAVIYSLIQTFEPKQINLIVRDTDKAEQLKEQILSRRMATRLMVFNIADAEAKYALSDSTLIVNATPVGLSPKSHERIYEDKSVFSSSQIVYDLIYAPLKTTLLQDAESEGAKTISGLEMLIAQGAVAFELWTGQKMPIEIVRQKLMSHIDEQQKQLD
jgi:shikimate dehydrogenase